MIFAGSESWVVGPGECLSGEFGVGATTSLSCKDPRGGVFNSSLSTSWNTTGNYSMDIDTSLGYGDDCAAYGFDTIALDLSNATGGPSLDNQVIGAFAKDDFYLGLFFGYADQNDESYVDV